MDSKAILKRLDALRATLRPLPTFEEFLAQWGSMDELSQSLILHDLSVEEYRQDRFLSKIGTYLTAMGIEPEPSYSLREAAKELNSDP